MIKGIKWINKDRKIFCWVWMDGIISFLLWIILINIDIENVAVISDIINSIIIVFVLQLIILDINIISLIVLIDGGAEMLVAININHQNVMFGAIIIIPLNIIIFREWYLLYISFTSRKRADEDNPWAIIIIIAPIIPIVFIVKIPVRTNPIWATEE